MLVGATLVLVALVGGRHRSSGSTASPPTASTTTVDVSAEAVPSGTTAPVAAGGLGVGFAPATRGRTALRGFSEVRATITSSTGTCRACLLAATTAAQRERGLMGVTDRTLGGYDGMAFVFAGDVSGGFWMRDTPLPLSIAFFDARGRLLGTTDMAPCGHQTTCTTYDPPAPFRFAVEVPQGELRRLKVTKGAHLTLRIADCPLAKPSS